MVVTLFLPIAASSEARSTTDPVAGPSPDPTTVSSTDRFVTPLAATPDATNRVPQARKRVWNSAEHFPATPIERPSTAPGADPGTLVLPTVTVTAEKNKSALPPPLHFDTPVKNLPAPEFESQTARADRLVKKHFTPLEQKLGRLDALFGGESLESRAKKKEAIESAALELNRISNVLEVSASQAREDAEALKKIRDEFLRAYYQRPR